ARLPARARGLRVGDAALPAGGLGPGALRHRARRRGRRGPGRGRARAPRRAARGFRCSDRGILARGRGLERDPAGRARRRGDTRGALVALRAALGEPAARPRRAEFVIAMARLALDGGLPDSARVYATWADSGLGPGVRPAAVMLAAAAWEASRQPDSALAA